MLEHDEVQAALSARLDGEKTELADDVVDAHLTECEQCQEFWDKAAALSYRLKVVESPSQGMAPPADLSEAILAGVEPEWRRKAAGRMVSLALARIMSVVLGLVLLIWAVMIVADTGGMVVMDAEGIIDPLAQPEYAFLMVEGAAMRLGISVGLFFAAWRPNLVVGMFPVVGTMWAFLTGITMRDLLLGLATTEQALWLLALLLTIIVFLWTWIAGRGMNVTQAWKGLTANPA